jgi:hypothetical protein
MVPSVRLSRRILWVVPLGAAAIANKAQLYPATGVLLSGVRLWSPTVSHTDDCKFGNFKNNDHSSYFFLAPLMSLKAGEEVTFASRVSGVVNEADLKPLLLVQKHW